MPVRGSIVYLGCVWHVEPYDVCVTPSPYSLVRRRNFRVCEQDGFCHGTRGVALTTSVLESRRITVSRYNRV